MTGPKLPFRLVILAGVLVSMVGTEARSAEPRYRVAYATYLGGSQFEQLREVIVYPDGSVLVGGQSNSTDLPTTPGVAQPEYAGDDPNLGHGGICGGDCFLVRLTADPDQLVYATYLGGKENEFAEHRPWLSPDGSVLLTGVTGSADFPTTPGVFQREPRGKTDGFLTKLSADGRQFVFSTLLGGSDGEFYLMPTPDAAGNVFLVGTTRSKDFPVTEDAVQSKFAGSDGKWDGDGAVALFSPDGSKLLYATYLGGSGADLIRSIALGPRGELYLVGSTTSRDFPVTPNAAQSTLGGKSDAFVVKLVPVR